MSSLPTIRIHHFFDIIRDFGGKTSIPPDLKLKNSYHRVAEKIRGNPEMKISLIKGADTVCAGCLHLSNGVCMDGTDKPGFRLKNNYNEYLDDRIMKELDLHTEDVKTPAELCRLGEKYLKNIFHIYNLDDPGLTAHRKENVAKGLKQYQALHGYRVEFT